MTRSYTTVNEVSADSATMFLLMNNANAMAYLMRSQEFAAEGCANEAFMKYLGSSPFLKSAILNDEFWRNTCFESDYYQLVFPNAIKLSLGSIYKMVDYKWIVAEQQSEYCFTLQSYGVLRGTWPGYKMTGTLENASGNQITLTAENTNYGGSIDGYDISNYNQTTKDLYASIKHVEFKNAPYGKGLFLISNARAGTTVAGSIGSGYYFEAIKESSTNYNVAGSGYDVSWLGSVGYPNTAWEIGSDGSMYGSQCQDSDRPIAPAFNIDTRLIKLYGNEIITY